MLVTLSGIVTDVNNIYTKSGQPGAKVMLEDYSGNYEIALFGKDYQEYLAFMQLHSQIFIEGEITERYFVKPEDRKGKRIPYGFKIKKVSFLGNIAEDHIESLNIFMTPDQIPEALKGKLVVLDSVAYPANQFYGGSGEYISCGKPSEGYYFVKLNGRHWLGPYEAAKRYRNEADSSMLEVHQWTVLGRITGVTAENPNGMKSTVGNFEFGWVVEPIALMVPGCLVSYFDAEAPSSGRYVAENEDICLSQVWT